MVARDWSRLGSDAVHGLGNMQRARGRIQRSAGESACSTKLVAEICSVAAEVLGSEAAEVLGSEAAQVLGSENAQVLGSEDAQVLMHGWVSRA